MATLDWSQCPAVESIPHRVGGAWVFKGTRPPIATLIENLEDLSIDESDLFYVAVSRPTPRETTGFDSMQRHGGRDGRRASATRFPLIPAQRLR